MYAVMGRVVSGLESEELALSGTDRRVGWLAMVGAGADVGADGGADVGTTAMGTAGLVVAMVPVAVTLKSWLSDWVCVA